MKIDIKVIHGAKKNSLEQTEQGYRVRLTAPPIDGRANDALIEFLAEHFQVPKSRIAIIKGLKSRNKTVNIMDI